MAYYALLRTHACAYYLMYAGVRGAIREPRHNLCECKGTKNKLNTQIIKAFFLQKKKVSYTILYINI